MIHSAAAISIILFCIYSFSGWANGRIPL